MFLLSGHHSDIALWRKKQALGRTWLKRPDLLEKKQLTAEEEKLLAQFKEDATR
jgi:tRNA (guanine37-N1)-methyltransferase